MPKGYPKAKPPQSTSSNGESISKMEAMRQVLDAHGVDIKPLEIQEHLKKQFGIDMDTKLISTYKTTITTKKKGKKVKKKMAASVDVPQAAAAPIARTRGITIDDIHAVLKLANRIGAEKLRELAEVLAK